MNGQTPRTCFYIPIEQFDKNGYIPSLVTEGQPGHQPLTGNGTAASPWYWGKTYEQALKVCADMNARRGISRADAVEIVLSSIGAPGSLEPPSSSVDYYDVTGVTLDQQYLPLYARVGDQQIAFNLAQGQSANTNVFLLVQVKDEATGTVIATFVGGDRKYKD